MIILLNYFYKNVFTFFLNNKLMNEQIHLDTQVALKTSLY